MLASPCGTAVVTFQRASGKLSWYGNSWRYSEGRACHSVHATQVKQKHELATPAGRGQPTLPDDVPIVIFIDKSRAKQI